MDIIVDVIVDYLVMQVYVGVEVLKIFDSWVEGFLELLFDWVIIWLIKCIVDCICVQGVDLLIIGFFCGVGMLYFKYVCEIGVMVLVFDMVVDFKWMDENLLVGLLVQGYFDLAVLCMGGVVLKVEVDCLVDVWFG